MSKTPGLGYNFADWRAFMRTTSKVVNAILNGKTNNTGIFTLDANATTTTLTDPRFTADSTVTLIPITATAMAAFGSLLPTTTGRVHGSLVYTHSNTAHTDKTFWFTISG